MSTSEELRKLLKKDCYPMGTFDDDPGGPWRAPGVPCECARGATKCPAPCPHHISQRPGFRS